MRLNPWVVGASPDNSQLHLFLWWTFLTCQCRIGSSNISWVLGLAPYRYVLRLTTCTSLWSALKSQLHPLLACWCQEAAVPDITCVSLVQRLTMTVEIEAYCRSNRPLPAHSTMLRACLPFLCPVSSSWLTSDSRTNHQHRWLCPCRLFLQIGHELSFARGSLEGLERIPCLQVVERWVLPYLPQGRMCILRIEFYSISSKQWYSDWCLWEKCHRKEAVKKVHSRLVVQIQCLILQPDSSVDWGHLQFKGCVDWLRSILV